MGRVQFLIRWLLLPFDSLRATSFERRFKKEPLAGCEVQPLSLNEGLKACLKFILSKLLSFRHEFAGMSCIDKLHKVGVWINIIIRFGSQVMKMHKAQR